MNTTILHLSKTQPVWSSRVVNLRLPKNQCMPGQPRAVEDALATHFSPAIFKAATNDGRNHGQIRTFRMRLGGGAYFALLDHYVLGVSHISAFHPGSKRFASWVRRVNSRGFLRMCGYDLFGRFFIYRQEFPERNFFESALEVHDASRDVSSKEFLQAVNLFDSLRNGGGAEKFDDLLDGRSTIIGLSVVDAGDGKGC